MHYHKVDMNLTKFGEPLNQFMSKANVGLIVVLKNLMDDQTLIIGNTHLLYNATRGDTKIGKKYMFLFFCNIVSKF